MMLHSMIRYSEEARSISCKSWMRIEMKGVLDGDWGDGCTVEGGGCTVEGGTGWGGGDRKWRGATENRVQP